MANSVTLCVCECTLCICISEFHTFCRKYCFQNIKHTRSQTYPLTHTHSFIFSLKMSECMCVVCVLLGSTSHRILNFLLQNLDNCLAFSMISLQFSIVNNFLSFKGVYTVSLQLLRNLREEERDEEREGVCFERLESHKLIGIF